jgi:hypothetical protein
MGGRASRNKGRAGEQALVRLLNDWMGEGTAKRNLDQVTRDGGATGDVAGEIAGYFAIECKSTKTLQTAFFKQAQDQAGDKIPVVAWKKTGTGKFQFFILMDETAFLEYAGDVMSSTEP